MISTFLQRYAPGLTRWWERASPRERVMLGAGALVVVAALGWTLVWQPMTADIARMQRDHARDHAVLAAARAQAADLAALARSARAAPGSDARATIERVIAERGLRPAVSSVDVQDGRVRVLFSSVRFEALAATLDALARADGVRLADAVFTTRVEPGTIRAELTFVRG